MLGYNLSGYDSSVLLTFLTIKHIWPLTIQEEGPTVLLYPLSFQYPYSDMLVPRLGIRGYLSTATPMSLALCSCVKKKNSNGFHPKTLIQKDLLILSKYPI